MNYFSPDELQTLISIIQDQHGLKLPRQQFTDISFDLFEDISGLEGVDPELAMECPTSACVRQIGVLD